MYLKKNFEAVEEGPSRVNHKSSLYIIFLTCFLSWEPPFPFQRVKYDLIFNTEIYLCGSVSNTIAL